MTMAICFIEPRYDKLNQRAIESALWKWVQLPVECKKNPSLSSCFPLVRPHDEIGKMSGRLSVGTIDVVRHAKPYVHDVAIPVQRGVFPGSSGTCQRIDQEHLRATRRRCDTRCLHGAPAGWRAHLNHHVPVGQQTGPRDFRAES